MPLILPQWRDKLAYPAGRLPGFDPTHPAAQNCGFSGIAANGGIFASILSGRIGSNATGPSTSTTSLYGPLGLITRYESTVDNTVFPYAFPAGGSVTMAGIFKVTGPSLTVPAYVLNNDAAGNSNGIGWDIGSTGNFSFITGAGTTNDTGISVAFETPYFYAASFRGSDSLVNYVILKLATGKTFSATVATGDGATSVGDGNIWVGNRGANNRALVGGIATAMASNAFMSEQQLRKWAEDPWAFWYPRQTQRLIVPADTPIVTATQYAAFCTPQRDGAVYTQMTGY